MPQIIDHIAYFSHEIGPRPAGTEEEQQAALYITEQIQKEAGLPAVIEDFTGSTDSELPRMILSGVSVMFAILALVLDVMTIPAIVLTLISAVILLLESFGKPVISQAFSRGVSQNVIAKYEPGPTATGSSRRRKVVVIANYDSGKNRAELSGAFVKVLPILNIATLVASAVLPILLLLKSTLFAHAAGPVTMTLLVIIVIAALLAAVPLIFGIMHKVASYNDGANCNASGVAVMMDVATRLGRGRKSAAELAEREVLVHGPQAAQEAGVIPEGASVSYHVDGVNEPPLTPQSAEERLQAAKAAVAALTGKSVNMKTSMDIAAHLVKVNAQPPAELSESEIKELRNDTREAFASIPSATLQQAYENAEANLSQEGESSVQSAAESAAEPSAPALEEPPVSGGVPDWFKKAQEKAKKNDTGVRAGQRSKYATALDAAVGESSTYFNQANTATETALSDQLKAMQDDIREVKAPQYTRMEYEAAKSQGIDLNAMGAGAPDREVSASSNAGASLEGTAAQEADARRFDVEGQPAVRAHSLAESIASSADAFAFDEIAMPALSEPAMPAFMNRQAQQNLGTQPVRTQASSANAPAAPEAAEASAVPLGSIPLFAGEQEASARPLDLAAEPRAGRVAPVAAEESREARAGVVLPLVGEGQASASRVAEASKQRAPLADAETGTKRTAKSLLTLLPSLSGSLPAVEDAKSSSTTPRASDRAGMRAVLPSLSGSISKVNDASVSEEDAVAAESPSKVGIAGMTGAFAPVGEELLENVDPEDIYVDDADDSAYEGNFTETGAFAGPGYVEMPKSRVGGFFGKFRKKKKKQEDVSTQEWLDVDDSFDAREVGKERGGWESFRQEDDADKTTAWKPGDLAKDESAYSDEGDFDFDSKKTDAGFDYDDFGDDSKDEFNSFGSFKGRSWNGGAFSKLRFGKSKDVEEDDFEEDYAESPRQKVQRYRSEDGDRRPDSGVIESDMFHDEVAFDGAPVAVADRAVDGELEQIYQFRHPDIDTEVWFVALGSELSGHSGLKAFLADHEQELKGSIIIELDALGAGELSLIEREGALKKVTASSRMHRYISKATQETGISIGKASILYEDSSASFATAHGIQSMHLAGIENGKLAHYAEASDTLDAIDERKLARASDYIIALLKNI